MTWAADQPNRRRWSRSEVVHPSGIRATVRPLGAAGVGLLSALVGAWGAISVFVGPDFGYRPTSHSAWQWTTDNWLLHLVPGAVAVAAGLLIMSLSPARRAGRGAGGGLGFGGLLLVAAGTWFVIGPALWRTFESSAPFSTGTSAGTSFVNQLGSSLGPGLLLAVLGGMALKAATARPAVAVGEAAVESRVAESEVAGTGVAEPGMGRRRMANDGMTDQGMAEPRTMESRAVADREGTASGYDDPALREGRGARGAGGVDPEVTA